MKNENDNIVRSRECSAVGRVNEALPIPMWSYTEEK